MALFIYFEGCRLKFLNFDIFDSADADEMPHFVASHLGLYCLPKYPFKYRAKICSLRKHCKPRSRLLLETYQFDQVKFPVSPKREMTMSLFSIAR